jgi:hypothetical protein
MSASLNLGAVLTIGELCDAVGKSLEYVQARLGIE